MKKIPLLLMMSALAFFSACKDNAIAPADLNGNWSSEEVYVNGKLQADDISKTTHLGLNADKLFFRNYVVGKWQLDGKKLSLLPNEDARMKPVQYEVINLSENTLTLKITLKESDYSYNFKGIEPNEVITVTEKYLKK